jgi:hypothetical protein
MAVRDEFKITEEIRNQLAEIFQAQYELVENKIQKLFTFDKGDYTQVKEYHNKVSFTENNIAYSDDGRPLMSIFAFTGKRSLKIEKILNRSDLKILGVRVMKDCVVPIHIDPNYQSTGRENPVHSIVVAGGAGCMIYFSNRKDGTRQAAVPGLSEFIMHPTEMAHGGYAGDRNMDIIQIMVDPL